MRERRGLEPGERLGRFEIRAHIGTGGFGNVYRAWDPTIGRPVALKTCESEDPGVRERFAREARLAGGLDHPNIVRIFDFQDSEHPWLLVQEYLDGEDLSALLARGAPLSAAERFRILDETARGLAYAHARGVVHRDVKPANLRRLSSGTVKILDFGIAKRLDAEAGLTRPGVTIGSLGHMAPEQIDGGEVDQRADLFALGIVAYELFAGRPPFAGESIAELFQRILHDEPEPLTSLFPELAAELDALVLQCLEKDAALRPSTAEEFRERLASAREASASRGRSRASRGVTRIRDSKPQQKER
jgi:eukaryotic-like serine/threonine-protein kinase